MSIKEKLQAMNQRDIGGSHLWIKSRQDCLTIHRGTFSICVENKEGEWTEEEIRMAIELYPYTEAAKR